MSEPLRRGKLRMICLVCGEEIGHFPQLVHGAAVPVFVYREGRPAGTGYAHPACAPDAPRLDLTGKPDFSDYDDDSANPAYAPGYDAVERGKGFDAAMREEAVEIAAQKGQEPKP